MALALVLGGCSYRPLYGTSQTGESVAAAMANVSVPEQKSRAGQLVRNELLSSFGGGGAGGAFILKLEPDEKTQVVSSVSQQKVSRHRYRLNVKYALLSSKDGKPVNEGASFSNVSYDTVEQPIADLRAADDARERAAREVAEDIRIRIAAALSSKQAP